MQNVIQLAMKVNAPNLKIMQHALIALVITFIIHHIVSSQRIVPRVQVLYNKILIIIIFFLLKQKWLYYKIIQQIIKAYVLVRVMMVHQQI